MTHLGQQLESVAWSLAYSSAVPQILHGDTAARVQAPGRHELLDALQVDGRPRDHVPVAAPGGDESGKRGGDELEDAS